MGYTLDNGLSVARLTDKAGLTNWLCPHGNTFPQIKEKKHKVHKSYRALWNSMNPPHPIVASLQRQSFCVILWRPLQSCNYCAGPVELGAMLLCSVQRSDVPCRDQPYIIPQYMYDPPLPQGFIPDFLLYIMSAAVVMRESTCIRARQLNLSHQPSETQGH